MTKIPGTLPSKDNIVSPEAQQEKKRKWRDFWLGLLLSLAVNVVLGGLLTAAGVVVSERMAKDNHQHCFVQHPLAD